MIDGNCFLLNPSKKPWPRFQAMISAGLVFGPGRCWRRSVAHANPSHANTRCYAMPRNVKFGTIRAENFPCPPHREAHSNLTADQRLPKLSAHPFILKSALQRQPKPERPPQSKRARRRLININSDNDNKRCVSKDTSGHAMVNSSDMARLKSHHWRRQCCYFYLQKPETENATSPIYTTRI